MYYDVCIHRRGENIYRRELIRESFRRNGKGCKRTPGKSMRNRKDAKDAKHNRLRMDGGQHHAWVGTGHSRVRRLSRVCALTARSADGTELFHGLPRLCGLDGRLLEAVGLNLDAPLPVVNSKSVVDAGKKLQERRKSL